MTPASLQLLAQYNAGMNQQMYAAAAQLPHSALAAERLAFFGSILGTMNHLLVGDTIWLRRFASHPAGYSTLLFQAGVDIGVTDLPAWIPMMAEGSTQA